MSERRCALCSQPFIALDIVLRYRDTETHYVFCPHERWTPPPWPTCSGFLPSLTEPDRCVECWLPRSEHAPSSVGHDSAGGRGA